MDVKYKNIIALVEDHLKRYPGEVIIAIPDNINQELILRLWNIPSVTGFIFPEDTDTSLITQDIPFGIIHYGGSYWHLPNCTSKAIIFLGKREQISFYMMIRALPQGIFWVTYLAAGCFLREFTPAFLIQRLKLKFYQKFFSIIKYLQLSYRVNKFILKINSTFNIHINPHFLTPFTPSGRIEAGIVKALESGEVPLISQESVIEQRILLINSSLAWGGAERQIVNTLIGLKKRGYRDVSLLCEYLGDPYHDFNLPELQREGITVCKLRRGLNAFEDIQEFDFRHSVADILKALPVELASEVGNYIFDLIQIKPQVIHIWQDSTGIKAGLAAALIGIPHIIISTRNMAPFRFNYYLPYMFAGYRALSGIRQVTLLNNSHAGAQDYAYWLQLPKSRFQIMFNGINLDYEVRLTENEILLYRKKLGIPDNVRIIGSIFRFYAEKDPLLWVKTAAEIVRTDPECVFLLIGTGPMHDQIVSKSRSLGIADRLFLPGTEKRPELPLSLMDVFLLTSKLEGTPNVVIEAQMCGVPVVATQAGGISDTIDNGNTGWIVDKRSPDLLAERVLFILNNSEWRNKAQKLSRKFINQRFDMDNMIDNTLNVYGLPKFQPLSDVVSAPGK